MRTALSVQATGVLLCVGLLAVSLCGVTLCQPRIASAQAPAACGGDCGGDRQVTVNELVTMVDILLGRAQFSACPVGDADSDGIITVSDIIVAVNNALSGCPTGTAACGDRYVDSGEECDNSGICIGGDDTGTTCRSDAACHGQGACIDGPNANRACNGDGDCPSSTCVHCRPFGGDGCAANCTRESDVLVNLKPGVSFEPEDPLSTNLDPTTSGIVVHGDFLSVGIPFPPNGSQTFTIGKERDRKIPAVMKTALIHLPRLPVGTLACVCLRGIEFRTCGGTLNEVDGTPSTDCTPAFTAGDSVCDGKKPCASVFGPGNGGSGTVGCDSLDGANLTVTQDSGGGVAPPSPPVVTLADTGGQGSVVLHTATSLGFVIGHCSDTGPDYGADGELCTEDDSQESRGMILPATLVSGTANATVMRANGNPDDLGPFSSTGAPLMCSALSSGNVSGSVLAGAFTDLNAPQIFNIVVTDTFAAQ